MSTTTPGPAVPPRPASPTGLRERKKAKTRWAIQEHALRLFAEQGYEATTVDQIAAAAEISPSTFFRYFGTKEDVVVQDEFDDLLMESLRAAGASDDPLASLRGSLRQVIATVDANELRKSQERTALIISVPSLRARSFDNILAGFDEAVTAFATAGGRSPDDARSRAFVGAFLGALLPVLMQWHASGYTQDVTELIDAALGGLQEILTWR
jgi:AcrR family transcriptional regulator